MPAERLTTSVDHSAHGKEPGGPTKASGPKLTLMLAICAVTGGLLLVSWLQPRPKEIAAADLFRELVTVTPAPVKAVTVSSAPVVAAAATAPLSVTITGCLERAADTFRLKDSAGAAVPKARSWKSGFLKKSATSIDVVDASHTLKLADHVGRRVSVTGAIVDREMQVQSLRRVAPSCRQRSGA